MDDETVLDIGTPDDVRKHLAKKGMAESEINAYLSAINPRGVASNCKERTVRCVTADKQPGTKTKVDCYDEEGNCYPGTWTECTPA